MPNEERETGFKVVDRRSFTEEGKRREEAAQDEREPSRPSSPPPAGRPAAAPRPRAAMPEPAVPEGDEEAFGGEFAEIGPVGFETLIQYLSTTAMFQLGFLPGPGGERIPADLANARRTIDLLEVVQHKTDGNLTDEESRMLEEVLYELRMSFVEVQKRLAKTTK